MRSPIPLCFLALLFAPLPLLAQFEGEGVRYAMMQLRALPDSLRAHPDALLLDVRSPGEYSDSSQWEWLNIGHLRGAVNISVDSIAAQYERLRPYRNKPVYVQCSHSQRSRYVCLQLADSGFTRLTNVNGGLSQHASGHVRSKELDAMVEHGLPYATFAGADLCGLLRSGAFLLDVRPDSLLDPMRISEATLAMGSFPAAVHIPAERLADRMASLPRDRMIVVMDEYGPGAHATARRLMAEGFQRVGVVYGGMEGLLSAPAAEFPCRSAVWHTDVPYRVAPLSDVDPKAYPAGRIIDVREPDEYASRAKTHWHNVGRLTGSVNIPAAEIGTSPLLAPMDKKAPLLLVGGMDDAQVYTAARTLTDQGFQQVTVLVGGVMHVRWAIHNLEGMEAWSMSLEQSVE